MQKKMILGIGLFLAAAVLVVSCGGGAQPAPASKPAPVPAPATAPAPAPKPAPAPAPTPTAVPAIPHSLDGRGDCLLCHKTGIGGGKAVPASHAGRTNDTCQTCHKPK